MAEEGPRTLTGILNRTRRSTRWVLRESLVIFGFFTLFWLLGQFACWFEFQPGYYFWFPGAGLALVLLTLYGLRHAITVLVAYFSFYWAHHPELAWETVLILSSTPTLNYAIASHFLKERLNPEQQLRDTRDALWIIGVATTAPLATASISVLQLSTAGLYPSVSLSNFFLIRWLADCSGIFSVAPLLLVQSRVSRSMLRDFLEGAPSLFRWRKEGSWRALEIPGQVAASAFSVLIVFGLPGGPRMDLFFLIFPSFIWITIGHGLPGASLAIAGLMWGSLFALVRVQAEANLLIQSQLQLVLMAVTGLLVGSVISKQRRSRIVQSRREAIQRAVRTLARRFLESTSGLESIQLVLENLGQAVGASRCYMVTASGDGRGTGSEAHFSQWSNRGTGLRTRTPELTLVLTNEGPLKRWNPVLTQGQQVMGLVRDLPPEERSVLEAHDVRSVLIVPVFREQRWLGFLGFEDCLREREWLNFEIDGLGEAAETIGSILCRSEEESRLKASEECFRQLTESIPEVFWMTTPQSDQMIYVSPSYADVWGHPREMLEKDPNSWLESICSADRQRVLEALTRLGKGKYDEEYRIERPDGSLAWIRDRRFPVTDEDGRIYRIAGISEDVTKDKKAENELRATTLLLTSLIDNLQSAILVEDEARRITHLNQAFCQMFKIPTTRKSLLGVDSRIIFTKPPEFVQRIEEIITHQRQVTNEEITIGDGRTFECDYIPIFVGDHDRGHLWQYRDITERKQVEEQIKTSLREKEVLLKEIHHRVKNNLQVVSSLLNLQSGYIQDRQALDMFKESQNRVRSMALIHEKLYQSKDLARIDIAEYIRNLSGYLLRSYGVNTNTVRLNINVDSVSLDVDTAIPCGLIINELLSNSFKYAFPDGRQGEINIELHTDAERHVQMLVSDNGVGMENGRELRNTTGSLGLKLVGTLADQLGGNIEIQNRNGTAFRITFSEDRN